MMPSFLEFIAENALTEDQYQQAKVTKSYTITASPELLHRFENLMAYLQWCATEDHDADIAFHIDGKQVNFLVHGAKQWKNRGTLPLRPARVERPVL